jgi:hypothetical protein
MSQFALEHDPEKHALGPRPDGWVPVFPRDKREAFARRSCSNKNIERDDDPKKSHQALGHLRYAMIHNITIVPIGTNENSDHHGDRPMRRKIRHDGTIVAATSTK